MSDIIRQPLVPDVEPHTSQRHHSDNDITEPLITTHTTPLSDDDDATVNQYIDDDDSDTYDDLDGLSEFDIRGKHLRTQTSTPNANHYYNPPTPTNTTATTRTIKPFASHKVYIGHAVSHTNTANINSQIGQYEHKQRKSALHRVKDRANRATIDNVLDALTRTQINKLFVGQLIDTMNGTISTGKEANVYSVQNTVDNTVIYHALKVYKTSILVFKDRDMYITGEARFQSYSKNPRKMVKLWAEKEFRNLKRLQQFGLPAPVPLALKSHVLLMTLIGDRVSGTAAPRLKDAQCTNSELGDLYVQCVKLMRRMYIKCRLVHGDLSEYNMLVHNHTLYMIDVSQSVEHEHPYAAELLKKDCINATRYFSQSVAVMTVRELFAFVTSNDIGDSDTDMDLWLDNMLRQLTERGDMVDDDLVNVNNNSDASEFVQTHIPRSLSELTDYEKALQTVQLSHGQQRTDDVVVERLRRLAVHSGANSELTKTTVTSAGNKDSTGKKLLFALDLMPVAENQTTAKTTVHTAHHDDNADEQSDDDSSTGSAQQAGVRFDVSDSQSDSDSNSVDDDDGSDATHTTHSNTDSDNAAEDVGGEWVDRPVVSADAMRAERKSHKKQVKAERAEKRKDKLPKKVKKMKTKKRHK